jgi:hypothetical protein
VRRRLLILAALAIAVSACGGGTPAHTTRTISSAPPATTPAATASTPRTPPTRRVHHHHHHYRPAIDPGTLPQTPQLPSAGTPAFHAEMAALWTAIRTGSAPAGRAAFFPETAYAQIKAIGDPESDWSGRLFADFALDVAAAHAVLGSGAAHARLAEVQVPGAHWVAPNVCLNRVGYYEVPNARLVYDESGQTRSLGIASMISWRGVWYVVHLGAVVRQAAVGIVDDPSAGTGTSVPSSTC